jgi:hypothetical protein
MTTTLSLVALCLAGVIALPLAGALFGFGLAWGRDLYAARRLAAESPEGSEATATQK